MNKYISSIAFAVAVALLFAGCYRNGEQHQSAAAQPDSAIPDEVLTTLSNLAKNGHFDEALRVLRPYAEKGIPEAQFGMATGLITKGGKIDNQEVLSWVRKSASQGHLQALEFLSISYRQGDFGLPTNSIMAEMWASATTNLALIPKCLARESSIVRTNSD